MPGDGDFLSLSVGPVGVLRRVDGEVIRLLRPCLMNLMFSVIPLACNSTWATVTGSLPREHNGLSSPQRRYP